MCALLEMKYWAGRNRSTASRGRPLTVTNAVVFVRPPRRRNGATASTRKDWWRAVVSTHLGRRVLAVRVKAFILELGLDRGTKEYRIVDRRGFQNFRRPVPPVLLKLDSARKTRQTRRVDVWVDRLTGLCAISGEDVHAPEISLAEAYGSGLGRAKMRSKHGSLAIHSFTLWCIWWSGGTRDWISHEHVLTKLEDPNHDHYLVFRC